MNVKTLHPSGHSADPPAPSDTLATWFARVAAARPDERACDEVTFRELETSANRVAHALHALGIVAGARVAVIAERSASAVAAIIGVLVAGGSYVPLDPEDPGAHHRLVLDDCAPEAVVTDRVWRARAVAWGFPVVAVGDHGPSAPPAISVAPGDVAYVIYTSGSTGRPKGVMVTHANAVQLLSSMQPLLGFGPDDVWSVFHSFAFDFSVWEMWGALLHGGRCVVVPFDVSRSPDATADLLVREGVTMLNLTPSAFRRLGPVLIERAEIPPLRRVILGGERLEPALLRPWFDRFGDNQPAIFNMYGITETTVHVTVRRMRAADANEQGSIIGGPRPGVDVRLCDDELRPVLDGAVGELVVGGAGVARGYLDRPDLDRDRFVTVDGARCYRTGDLGRRRPDGELEFVGRADGQVKVHGFRIETGEIEACLREHPDLDDAVVRLIDDRLVAWCVTADEVSSAELYRHVADRLPATMVPSAFVTIDRLPLTSNGKLDMGALPPPDSAAPPYRAPLGPTERLLTTLWAEALGTVDAGIGRDDNFLALGGQSLAAAQVLRGLQAAGRPTVSFREFFAAGTLAELAQTIDALREASAPALVPAQIHDASPAPATAGQEAALLAAAMADDALPYQFQARLDFRGPLDVGALERALTGIVRAHPIYRTRFVRRRHGWAQIVDAPITVRLPVIDLRGRPVEDLVLSEVARRIDPGRGPLVRWTLARVHADHHVLVHVEHHVSHDGWSWTLFLRDLVAAYGGGAAVPSALAFEDYARWQQQFARCPAGREQLDYWRTELAELPPPLALPWDRPRPTRQTYRGDEIEIEVPEPLAQHLEQFAREQGVTLFTVMLAAFAVVMARYAGQDTFVIGSGLANRRVPRTEGLIGMLVNTVALRVDVSGDPSVGELLRRLTSVVLEAQAHEELPFEEVVRAIDPERHAGSTPVYQVLFSFHDSPYPELDLPRLSVDVQDTLGNGSAKTDLNVIVFNRHRTGRPRTSPLVVSWNYSTDLADRATAVRMCDTYRSVLASLVGSPEGAATTVGSLPLVDDDERDRLLARSGREVPYERDATISEIFEARVGERPDAVAMVADGVQLTYAELNSRANRLAHHLAQAGVRRGDTVALLLERSPDTIIALLAALKAGAAYVALDPGVPAVHLQQLVDDAAPGVVCTVTRWAPRVDRTAATIVCLDAVDLSGQPDTNLPATATADDLAYIAYTSGSTGRPKGVEIPHRAVVRLVRSADDVDLGPDTTVLVNAPLAFDASTFEIWGPLLNSGRIALAPARPLAPHEIAELVTRFDVTTLWLTAGLFHQFVDRCADAVRGLHQLLAGGDVLSSVHVERALRLLPPGAALINGYGPTESTTFACCHRMPAGSIEPGPIPIGRPVPNTTVYVLDPHGGLAPTGVAGELCIGGDGLARGYRGLPGLTAERFVANPFSGGRLYRTGDRARVRADGVVEFLGRFDRQVKVRGYRVELDGIETELLRHPGVRLALVGVDDGSLAAAVVPAPPGDVSAKELKAFLAERLPVHEVPTRWALVDELPLTVNGKVVRSFPRPALELSPRRAPSDLEVKMVAVWEDVLDVRPVGLDDNFFDLGGHSMLAVELFAAIERRIGPRLPLASIFEAPTVEQLAELARREGWGAPWSSLVPINADGSRRPVFCVAAGDGNTVGYGALARHLGPDQPFYALQPRGLDGRVPLLRTVEGMARQYVRAVRSVQAHGPYLLVGRCLGGVVAYEMARRLEADGENVALLAVLDSLGPRWAPRTLTGVIVYDEVMNLARRRVPDMEPAKFIEWLRGPVTTDGDVTVNRYLYEAYLARPDVQAAYPLDQPGQAGRLVDWAWVSGRHEFRLSAAFLPPATPAAAALRPPRWRWTARIMARGRLRGLDWADVATRGRVASLARRRADRLQAISVEAVDRYRAEPYRGVVTLLRTEEFRDNVEIARWHGVDTGGVVERYVRATHRSMVREPDVVDLAAVLTRCIDEVTGS
jgi:amino acid adenylation domain-containing protein